MSTEKKSKENTDVSILTINGNLIDRNYILHKEIITGGKCLLTMSNQPKE